MLIVAQSLEISMLPETVGVAAQPRISPALPTAVRLPRRGPKSQARPLVDALRLSLSSRFLKMERKRLSRWRFVIVMAVDMSVRCRIDIARLTRLGLILELRTELRSHARIRLTARYALSCCCLVERSPQAWSLLC